MILCLCGYIGSGKSTIANELVENYGFNKLSFASKMKEELSKYYNVPIEHFGISKEKKKERKFEITQQLLCNLSKSFGVSTMYLKEESKQTNSLRELLQTIGTDYIRATDNYAHIRVALSGLDHDLLYVVDDCRFPNEVFMADLSIWLNRDGCYSDEHISEQLNKRFIDVEIDNNKGKAKVCEEIMELLKLVE